MDIEFKNKNTFLNFCKVPHHAKLAEFNWWFIEQFGTMLVTSAYRKKDIAIHNTIPLRAVDLRSWIYANPSGMVKYINSNWIYDPNKPGKKVCKFHNAGKGIHFHIQVHDNTACTGGNK